MKTGSLPPLYRHFETQIIANCSFYADFADFFDTIQKRRIGAGHYLFRALLPCFPKIVTIPENVLQLER